MALNLSNLSLERGKKTLVRSFNAHIAAGSVIALVGKNGAGKSSLLQSCAGIFAPTQGAILLEDEDIAKMLPKRRAQKVTMLQQHSPIQPYCLAQNRIAHGLIPRFGLDWPDEQRLGMVLKMAHQLSISALLKRRLHEMSGGEQRLIDIAKVLVDDQSSLILLDEPSVFLDFTQKKNLSETIIKRAEQGAIILFSSHDLDFIASTNATILMLEEEAFLCRFDQLLSSLGIRSSKDERAFSGVNAS